MVLLGVSGGPDSMYLLHKTFKKRKDIIVATVNYNIRDDSYIDVEIVKEYCQKNNIVLEVLEIDKKAIFKGNFEEKARKIRFDFFAALYKKYNCEFLLLAHHKDDFLETAIMQKRSRRKPFYYGIKEENFIDGMKVVRPLVFKKFKREIIEELNFLKLKFAIDKTNELAIYQRNKIRKELLKLSEDEKNILINDILLENQNLSIIENAINEEFLFWEKHNFSQEIFSNLKHKKESVFKFIHSFYNDIKLSSQKINSIIDFILSKNRTSSFLLKNGIYLFKKQGLLKFK
ncbi:tRNA lysidine(34) synthetase TilS [Mycoplasma tauri]|uniref:tRNA(Ile)-lysidine synthase n=2 Tax=Mycoplasma tauri TaxID=547987 RepID=A0A953T763_9MOLU|nr:tRNA lysidine(34) synthetase TilS [Mycoplasma tauri]MBZ4195332.1 tRNA lysidine(34) synthetase TilS [Mycoplasma tauri]MBZ4204015.1 tRNA lysidine(34) synthetase TilS [Mycoplasma tauri]MBZ4218334.1 tRNA lysidine(34) synthetase TilS [Mycoplasma tauri]QSB07508.1 tRNA lysidine(34) synthetase TilS [Mycoplasma tauri]